jgi:hypothetical protein
MRNCASEGYPESVDAAIGFITTSVANLTTNGVAADDIGYFQYNNYGLELYSFGLVCLKSYARKNPALLRGFLKAAIKGARAIIATPAEAMASVKTARRPARRQSRADAHEADEHDRIIVRQVSPRAGSAPSTGRASKTNRRCCRCDGDEWFHQDGGLLHRCITRRRLRNVNRLGCDYRRPSPVVERRRKRQIAASRVFGPQISTERCKSAALAAIQKRTKLSVNRMTAPYQRSHLGCKTFDERYKLLNGAVIPRPIAFVSTLNEDGSVNAALFSSS